MKNRTALATAQLLIINSRMYENEKGRELSRYRVSNQSLKKFANRKVLQQGFIDPLRESLAELGWHLIQRENEFALVESAKVDSWTKLSSKRLRDASILKMSDEDVDQLFETEYGDTCIDESTDEE